MQQALSGNRFFKLMFMKILKVRREGKLQFVLKMQQKLSFKCNTKIVTQLKESVQGRELCRVYNLYHDFIKSLAYINIS